MLRLVRDDDDPLPPRAAAVAPPSPIAEIVRELRRIRLELRRIGGIPYRMGQRATTACVEAGGSGVALAMRIGPDRPSCQVLLDSWRADLIARGCKPHSIDRMISTVKACCRSCAWGDPGDVSYQSAVNWLAGKAAGWKPATINQAVSTLRGFSAHLQRCGALTTNPLQPLQSVKGQGDPGSRAESVEAVRRLLQTVINAHLTDRRRKGCAPLFWYFLATTGLRYNEARSIRWQDVDLEGGTITTDPAWCKARRMDLVPVYHPLLEMLRDWRAMFDDSDHKTSNIRIFPIVPNHLSFRQHRDAASIPAVDGRRRPFTPHGLRKSFATWLDSAGCPAGIRSLLVRHAATLTEERYTDPPLEEMRAWVARLPDPWPEGVRVIPARKEKMSDSGEKIVGLGPDGRYSGLATMETTQTNTAFDPAAPRAIVADSARRSGRGPLRQERKSPIRQPKERGNGQGLTENDEFVASVLADYLAARLAPSEGVGHVREAGDSERRNAS